MVVSCLGPSNPAHHLLPLDSLPSNSARQLPSSPPPSPRAWPKILTLLLPLPSRISVHAQLFLPPDLDRTEVTQYPLVVILPSVPNAHQVREALLHQKCIFFSSIVQTAVDPPPLVLNIFVNFFKKCVNVCCNKRKSVGKCQIYQTL